MLVWLVASRCSYDDADCSGSNCRWYCSYLLAAVQKAKETGDESFSKEDVTRYLQEEIERRNQSINQKLAAIEQLQREITNDQQQITECNFVLGQLANEEE